MTALGQPLAVFTDVSICDGFHAHEVNLVTDGIVAYAWAEGVTMGGDVEAVLREGTTLSASCPVPMRSDEPCGGHVSWDIATPAWTTDKHAVSLLQYAEQIEESD